VLEPGVVEPPKRKAWLIPTFAALAMVILLWSFWPVDPTLVSPPLDRKIVTPTATPVTHARSEDAVDLALVPEETIPPAPPKPETNIAQTPTVISPARTNVDEPTPNPPLANSKGLPPSAEGLSGLKLQSIIYNPSSPSVLINGQQLTVGQRIQGATVLSISPQNVILDVRGTKTTLTLKEVKP
jgi:hypothetical protein